MQELKITKKAHKLLVEESLRHTEETGGLLIGTLLKPMVIKASRAGILAKTSSIFYTDDVNHDNQVLSEAIIEYKGKVKLIGIWHHHCFNMKQPSKGDLEQAKALAREYGQNSDKNPFFYIITNKTDKGIALYGYSLSPGQEAFSSVSLETIEDDSIEIENALKIEPTIFQPKDTDFWNDLDFQFYLTKRGHGRLKQELNELVAHGYNVKADLHHNTSRLRLFIEKNGRTLLCLPPVEYPFNPPRFFENNNEIDYPLLIWNSTRRIIDILINLETRRGTNEGNSPGRESKLRRFSRKIEKAIRHIRFLQKE